MIKQTKQKIRPFVMKPSHRSWNRFCDILAGPTCCNFQRDPVRIITFRCKGNGDYTFATKVLIDLGADVVRSIAFFEKHGGFCDCEILLNVENSCL